MIFTQVSSRFLISIHIPPIRILQPTESWKQNRVTSETFTHLEALCWEKILNIYLHQFQIIRRTETSSSNFMKLSASIVLDKVQNEEIWKR
jgi:hypothetical protein